MKIRRSVSVAAEVILLAASLSSAQDQSIGDVARQSRSEKSQAPHAAKVVTDEDIGPKVGPIAETDDPADVVNKAAQAFAAGMSHTCRHEVTNNSGPGSFAETITELAGPDRAHLINNQRGLANTHTEIIIISQQLYSRSGNGPWVKSTANVAPSLNPVPESLMGHYSGGEVKFVRRDMVGGAIVFVYETKYHPGGVSNRDRTINFWIGIKDGLLRRVEMVTSEATASFIAPTVDRDVTTCTYGPIPEIKPPM